MRDALLATARAIKVSLVFLGSVLLSCVAATILSGFLIAVVVAMSGSGGMATTFFLYYCFFAFGIGSPFFLLLGVPTLHFVPGLKHAHPYSAAVAGAAIAGGLYLLLRVMHGSSGPFDSLASSASFVAFPSLWAATASCIYQRTRELRSAA
ncbi:hypothetical protein M3O57_15840 [Xanthomonas nasturtii]|uniref:hypothetical protein n=1 Tax=Xanthomonas nasturtii TaxID=1843581 RepID=UPI0011C06064|nr:hypothetical protein [Xanthomonas nasturtii]MCL1526815.1 hypothetical protein [Xanthomonas nasturtii]MCL1531911.1 hypothetical protein [Xanthomonas nasturtii]MCL1534526.1 hypothetical protein [Xanthomonas nasturtii]MCL1544079.1 hypothetical protein [Xanthomonas nasturtii]MCL1566622.1 hypothetical protein [Xanthomonas nasturtii]